MPRFANSAQSSPSRAALPGMDALDFGAFVEIFADAAEKLPASPSALQRLRGVEPEQIRHRRAAPNTPASAVL